MDTATLVTAMFATIMLMATMMVHPVAAEDVGTPGITSSPSNVEIGAPAVLATPDGGPGQFEHEETANAASSSDLMGGITREFRTNNKTIGTERLGTDLVTDAPSPSDVSEASDIVMTGGGPGESSTAFEFNLENVNE